MSFAGAGSLHCYEFLASSATLIFLASRRQLLAGIALSLNSRNKLVCVGTSDYTFSFQESVSAV